MCLRFSALLDRLGLHHVTADDVRPIEQLKCMCHLDNVYAKDGSSLFFLRVRRLPSVSSSPDYAVSIIRSMLFLLEQARRSQQQQMPQQRMSAGPDEGGDAPDKPKGASASGSTAAAAAAARSSTADKYSRDRYTFLVDVSRVETKVIHALGPALAQGRELLHQAYPLSIARVLLFTGNDRSPKAKGSGGGGGGVEQQEEVAMPADGAAAAAAANDQQKQLSTEMTQVTAMHQQQTATAASKQKKSSVLSFLTRKDDTQGLAGKMWLSVTVSAFKLKYLPSSIRSRVVLSDKLDAFCSVEAVNAYLEQKGFELLQ